MNRTDFNNSIAATRRVARKAGWSLAKVNAAEACAYEWANATQNRNDKWDDAAWRHDAQSHFCSITDGEFDGTWEDAYGWQE